MQLQYVQLVNTADPSSDIFTILVSVTWTKNTNSFSFYTFRQKLANNDKQRNKGSTEPYCLFVAANSIVDPIIFISRIILSSEK